MNQNIKWFRYLKPNPKSKSCLLSYYNPTTDSLIVAKQSRSTTKTSFTFAYFNNYIEFYRFQLSIPIHEKHFHEVILSQPQKARFDIDISSSSIELYQETLDSLIDSISQTIQSLELSFSISTDILVLTSHGNTKKSCHVILPNLYHLNNKDAKAFFDTIINLIPQHLRPSIDPSIYSSTQQFRMLHSSKFETHSPPRIKKLESQWLYRNNIIKYTHPDDIGNQEIFIFYSSLITTTDNLTLIPLYNNKPNQLDINIQIPEKFIHDIITLCSKHINPFPFKFRSITNNMICLDRLNPSYCSLCKRTHEKDNPYIILTTNKKLYFYCRRGSRIPILT